MKNKLSLIIVLTFCIFVLSGCALAEQKTKTTQPLKSNLETGNKAENKVVVRASNTDKIFINTKKEDDGDLEVGDDEEDDNVAVNVKNLPSTNVVPTTVLPVTKSDIITSEKTFSMDEVRVANNINKCWTVISGNVYDLTSYVNGHRGGVDAILPLCGTDGSAAFNGQHGGQRKPAYDLTKLLIGKLK